MNDSPTPIFRFPEDTPYAGMILKHEDLSETGSHKFRYVKPTLERLKAEGVERVVLSTTGNFGITASHFGRQLGIEVICLLSDGADMHRAHQIQAEEGVVIISSRPVRFSKYLAKRYQIPLLRMSSDASAPNAYQSLGRELMDQVPDADVIVNFATSGTSTLGIAQAYKEQGRELPAFHVVQAGRTSSVAKALHPDTVDEAEENHGVGLQHTPHHEELLELMSRSGGGASYITREQQAEAAAALTDFDLMTSYEGLSCFAAALPLLKRHRQVLVIFSGKDWDGPLFQPEQVLHEFAEVDALIESL